MHYGESLCELRLAGYQTLHALAEQKIRSGIQREAEEQVVRSHSRTGVSALQHGQENLHVGLEGMQIGDTVFDELRPQQAPRLMPALAIGRENTQAQEIIPLLLLVSIIATGSDGMETHTF